MDNSIVTVDLSRFGYRELELAQELFNAMINQGTPDDFEYSNITLNFNLNSGNVFLSNEDYQVAMMNGDALESFYSCPICGHEGFKEEMGHEGSEGCAEYLDGIGFKEEEKTQNA